MAIANNFVETRNFDPWRFLLKYLKSLRNPSQEFHIDLQLLFIKIHFNTIKATNDGIFLWQTTAPKNPIYDTINGNMS